MHFTKMHGTGNDFIIINNMVEQLPSCFFPHLASTLCKRHFSIGADGLMLISAPRNNGDFYMHFFNADGSEGEMCGNGARCICRYAIEHNLSSSIVHVETKAGPVTGYRQNASIYTIGLNTPTVLLPKLSLNIGSHVYECAYLELGNPGLPHVVLHIPNLSLTPSKNLYQLAKTLRFHPIFPKGANINFYDILPDYTVNELTYERGVEDFTFACGSGTGCTAAILALKGLLPPENIQVQTRGGTLSVSITLLSDTNSADSYPNPAHFIQQILLTGPAITVASGTIWQPNVIPESLLVLEDSIYNEQQGNESP